MIYATQPQISPDHTLGCCHSHHWQSLLPWPEWQRAHQWQWYWGSKCLVLLYLEVSSRRPSIRSAPGPEQTFLGGSLLWWKKSFWRCEMKSFDLHLQQEACAGVIQVPLKLPRLRCWKTIDTHFLLTLLQQSMIFICLACVESKTVTFQEKKMHLEKREMISCLAPLKDNQIQTVKNQSSYRADTTVFPLRLKRGCNTL